jgi:alpha-1,2-mannosyltransferase
MARGRGRGLTPPSAARVLLVATGVLAFVVRIGPVVAAGMLRGAMSYDEGVHLQVAQRLLAGQLTYRDVLFVHPPGVVLAQVPIAWLGQLVGEPSALAVSRCLAAGIGALTAVLVARLLLPRGLIAAGIGGAVAALFGPAVAADRVALLEGALSLGLVVALSALAGVGRPVRTPPAGEVPVIPGASDRSRRALVVGGAALGIAAAVKVWAALDVVLLVAIVAIRHGRSAAWRWAAGSAAAVVVVVGPFALLAPGSMWRDVVTAQLHRPRPPGPSLDTLVTRVAALEPIARLGGRWLAAAAVGVMALVAAGLLVALARLALRFRTPVTRWTDPTWWFLIGAAHLAALVAAPSHYLHYDAFLTVPLALVVGVAAGSGSRRVVGRASAIGLGTVLVVVLGTLASTLPALTPGAAVSATLLDREAHGCVWVREVQFLMVADLSRQQIERGCAGQPDLFGQTMATYADPDPAAALAALDHELAHQLANSDVAFLRATDPRLDLGPLASQYLARHFVAGPTTGSVQVWRRTDPVGSALVWWAELSGALSVQVG